MKTPFLFLIVMTLAPLLRAELVVYRESETAHVIVSGREATVQANTYWVYNPATFELSTIGYFAIGSTKAYAITNISTYVPSPDVHGNNGYYVVFSRTATTNDSPDTIMSAYFARGRRTYLDIGGGRRIATLPRTMKAMTRSLQRVSGQLAIYESTSRVVFQVSETKRANEAGENAAVVIERIRQRLEAQGYVPAS